MTLNPLDILLWVPLLGAIIVAFAPSRFARAIALAVTSFNLVPAVWLLVSFDPAAGMQRITVLEWIPHFGIKYAVGVDGLSILMVLLSQLIGLIGVLVSWKIEKQPRGYFGLFLFLQTAMTGVFIALDLFLFFVFWELMLLPMYFLIGIWGAPSRVDPDGRTRGGPYAAIKFFLYTMAGSLLMLVGIVALYNTGGTFDMRELSGVALDHQTEMILWGLFFAAFAVKIPLVPFHTWLPDAHVEAPTAISVVLAGILLKMGTYALIRINFSLFPSATVELAFLLSAWGVLNIIYGAFCAMAQTDMKRLVAYSSISHMGFVLLGVGAFYTTTKGQGMVTEALTGAVLQMFNHGTITAMLFILVGVIYDRLGHRDLERLGGLSHVMPRYATFAFLAFFASLGLPGLSGFVGEILILLGGWKAMGGYRILVGLAAFGIIIVAAYHIWLLQRAFLGDRDPAHEGLTDMSARETIALIPLAALVIFIGVYPGPAIDLIRGTVIDILSHVLRHG